MPAYKDPTTGEIRWRYRFQWQGKRYGGSTPIGNNTKKFAEQMEKEHLAKLQARQYTGVMPTLAEFAPRFLEYQLGHTKQLTHELHETIVTKHIVPHLGRLKLDEVRRAELDLLKTLWTCAPRTCNTRLGVAMRMLSLAVEWEILEVAPKTKLLKIAQDTPRFLTEDEASALVAAAKPQWRSMVMIGLRTGLRIGELRGLRWGDVQFDRALIHVRRTDPGRAEMDPNAPKGNRPRIVPLTPDAIASLREWFAGAKFNRPEHWVWPGVENWHKQTGRYRTRSEGNCATAMGSIAKKARCAVDTIDDQVTWHTLRHTYASWLVMRGVPLTAVQELLGHALIKQTMRYAHLAPGFAQHAAVAALDIPLVSRPALAQAKPAPPAASRKRLAPGPGRQPGTNRRSPTPRKRRRDP